MNACRSTLPPVPITSVIGTRSAISPRPFHPLDERARSRPIAESDMGGHVSVNPEDDYRLK